MRVKTSILIKTRLIWMYYLSFQKRFLAKMSDFSENYVMDVVIYCQKSRAITKLQGFCKKKLLCIPVSEYKQR